MNSLARISTPPAAQASPSRGVAKSLAMAEGALIPRLTPEPWPADLYRWLVTATKDLEDYSPWTWRPEQAWERIDALRTVLQAAPTNEALDAFVAPIREAQSLQPDRQQTIALVGMLLDSFPSGRPANLAAYADSLTHDLMDMGFNPPEVALACRIIRRRAKFLPTIGEMIEAAKEAKAAFSGAIISANSISKHLKQSVELLSRAEAALSASERAAEVAA